MALSEDVEVKLAQVGITDRAAKGFLDQVVSVQSNIVFTPVVRDAVKLYMLKDFLTGARRLDQLDELGLDHVKIRNDFMSAINSGL